MHQNKKELDDWLEEVEDVHKTIKNLVDGSEDQGEEALKLQKKLEFKKQQKIDQEAKAKRDYEEKLLKGTKGGGQTDNYKYYCVPCTVEYQTEVKTCYHCQKELITQKERRAQLMDKLGVYKQNKVSREERKKRWEMWRKTKAIYWKKNSTDYSKWDYFTDESETEEENLEKQLEKPVTPDNDPQFRAMKRDMDERGKKIKAQMVESDALKEQANKLLKKGAFSQAIETYTKAIEICRSNKYLYTNRALAYLKAKEFQKAVKDCDQMIEYCEVLENGFERSKDVAFKAFARRAQANYELKEFQKSLEDAEQGLLLEPADKGLASLKEEILNKKQYFEDLKKLEDQISQENETANQEFLKKFKDSKDTIDHYLTLNLKENAEELRTYNYQNLIKVLRANNKEARLYFYKNQGIKVIHKALFKKRFTLSFQRDSDLLDSLKGPQDPQQSDFEDVFSLFHILAEKDEIFMEGFKNEGVLRMLVKLMCEFGDLFFKPQDQKKDQDEEEMIQPSESSDNKKTHEEELDLNLQILLPFAPMIIEECAEALTTSTITNQKTRIYLKDKSYLIQPFFYKFYQYLMLEFTREPELLASVLTLLSNMITSDRKDEPLRKDIAGQMTEQLLKDFGTLIKLMTEYTFSKERKISKQKKKSFLQLRRAILGFMSNFFHELDARAVFVTDIFKSKDVLKTELDKVTDQKKISKIYDEVFYTGLQLYTPPFLLNVTRDISQLLISYVEIEQTKSNPSRDKIITKIIENFCAVIINGLYGIQDPVMIDYVQKMFSGIRIEMYLLQALKKIFLFLGAYQEQTGNMLTVITRIIGVLSKVSIVNVPINAQLFQNYCMNPILNFFELSDPQLRSIENDSIKLFVKILKDKKSPLAIDIAASFSNREKLQGFLFNIVEKEHMDMIRFCNGSSFICSLLDVRMEMAKQMKGMVPTLVSHVANKGGLFRKNAAILLARLCQDPDNLDQAKKLHGPELLVSLQQYILAKSHN